METLHRVFDEIIIGKEKFKFSKEDLETSLKLQLQKVLQMIVDSSPLLNMAVINLLIMLMVKHRSSNVKDKVPAIGISNKDNENYYLKCLNDAHKLCDKLYADFNIEGRLQ
jgi:hypothetical protein